MAYAKPQQRKKEESEKLRKERERSGQVYKVHGHGNVDVRLHVWLAVSIS